MHTEGLLPDTKVLTLRFPFSYSMSSLKTHYSDVIINSRLSNVFTHDPTEDIVRDLIVGVANPYEELSFKDGRITLTNIHISQDHYSRKIRDLLGGNTAYKEIVYELECLRAYVVYFLLLSRLPLHLYVLFEVEIIEISNTLVLYYSRELSLAHLYDNDIDLYTRYIMKRI